MAVRQALAPVFETKIAPDLSPAEYLEERDRIIANEVGLIVLNDQEVEVELNLENWHFFTLDPDENGRRKLPKMTSGLKADRLESLWLDHQQTGQPIRPVSFYDKELNFYNDYTLTNLFSNELSPPARRHDALFIKENWVDVGQGVQERVIDPVWRHVGKILVWNFAYDESKDLNIHPNLHSANIDAGIQKAA